MKLKNSGLVAGGRDQPKNMENDISHYLPKKGERYFDGWGGCVVVDSCEFGRVKFFRDGYAHPVITPLSRFMSEFDRGGSYV